ncbi:glycosyltransferase family 39 protein [Candidatus Sumerlaeota bacterium]|nr:glycosyltransferase family 39 protein [Candidatus Sumerlaeota bacterium]
MPMTSQRRADRLALAAVALVALADLWFTFLRPHDLPSSDYRVGMLTPSLLLAVLIGVGVGRKSESLSTGKLRRAPLLIGLFTWGMAMVIASGRLPSGQVYPLTFTVALFAMGLGFVAAAFPAGQDHLHRRLRWIPWVAVALFVVSFGLRHIGLRSMPGGLWVDEAEHFKNVFLRPEGHTPDPFGLTVHIHEGWAYISNLHLTSVALVVHWFGLSFGAMKLISTLPSALAPVGVFLCGVACRRSRVGLAAAILVATSPWHLIIGRWGNVHVACATLQVFAMAFLLRGLHRRGDQRSWVIAGILLGLCFYAYLLAPVALLIALLSVAAVAATQPDLRRRAVQGAGLMALGLALTAGPLLVTMIRHPETVGERLSQLSVLGDEGDGLVGTLLLNTVDTVGLLIWRGDANPRHNIAPPDAAWWEPEHVPAQIHLLWTALLLLGVALALLRWRRQPLPLILLIWLVVGLLPSVLCQRAEAPNAYRAQLVIPAVALLSVWSIKAVTRRVMRGELAVVTIAIAALSLSQFYGQHWRRPASVRAVWGGVETRAALHLREWGSPEWREGTTVFIDESLDTELISLMLHGAGFAHVRRMDITATRGLFARTPRLMLVASRASHAVAELVMGCSGSVIRDRFGLVESVIFSTTQENLPSDPPIAEVRGWAWRITRSDGSWEEIVGDEFPADRAVGADTVSAEGLWWSPRTRGVRLQVDTNCPYHVALEVLTERGEHGWDWEDRDPPDAPVLHDVLVYPQAGLSRVMLEVDTAGVESPRLAIAWQDLMSGETAPIPAQHLLRQTPDHPLWDSLW